MNMRITFRRTADISFMELTLLSAGEYKKYKCRISIVKEKWWLRNGQVVCDSEEGGARLCNVPADSSGVCIRPVIKFHSDALCVGDKIEVYGHVWTVIGDGIAICDDAFGEMPFDEGGSAPVHNYNGSDVEIYLNNIVHDYNM